MAAAVVENDGGTGCRETVLVGEREGFELSRMIEDAADAEVSWMIRMLAGIEVAGVEVAGVEVVGVEVVGVEVAWTI